jgi:hypothetical protein
MGTFDEAGWRAQTEWSDSQPSPAEVWGILSAPGIADWFQDRIGERLPSSGILQAGLATI